MKDSVLPPWWWAAAFILLLSLEGCFAQPASPAAQLAGDLYAGYTVLQLSPTETSSIRGAIAEAQAAAYGASNAFVILLNDNVGTLAVDETLDMAPEDKWVITTAAALQAAAEGTKLAPADLLIVRCGALKQGSFIAALDGFDTLELLGLSIQDCPSTAIDLMYGSKLVLANTQLLNNNAKEQAEFGGGAVLLESIGKVDVTNSACKHNYVVGSGGCLSGTKIGEFTAVNSTFVENWKSDEASGGRFDGGGALFFENSDRIAVTGSVFSGNAALYGKGGGIFCSNCNAVALASSVFTNNSALENGGALFGGDVGSVAITDCNFTANGELPGGERTDRGSAISFDGTRITYDKPLNIVVQSSRFIDNLSKQGAFHAVQVGAAKGKIEVHDCVFSGNQGSDEGGAILVDENQYTSLTLNRSTFTHNTAPYGPAVDCYDCDAIITDCVFDTNTAETDGGALQFFSTQAIGTGNKLQIVRCKFLNNTATDKFGGAAAIYSQAVSIQDSLFKLNMGGGGGAVYMEGGRSLRITGTTLDENTSNGGSGGALRLNTVGELVVDGVSFHNNMASSPTGIAQGGAIVMFTVTATAINNTNFTENVASAGGGAIAALNSDAITISNGMLEGNMAPLGAGIAVDTSTVTLENITISNNMAQEEAPTEEDSGEGRRKSRRLQQASNSVILQFASEVYASPTGGAILAQQSALKLQDCTLHNNTAVGDAGAVFIQQPTVVAINNAYFTSNVAQTGMGAGLVMRGTGAAAAAGIKNCTFAQNTAVLGSGGAAVIDSGLGVLDVACEACIFEGNTAGGSGGAISANGPTSFACTDCQSLQNSAGQQGGWMHCNGCSNTSIASGKSSNNSAGAAGGSVSCSDCGTFTTKGYEYHGNKASSGGAVAVQTAADIAVSDCTVTENTAGNVTKAAVLSPLVKRVFELPSAWQDMYGAGAATAGLGCNAQGAGGGLCMAGAEAANIADNTLTANQGSTGGALFASASCDASQPNCQSNKVNVTNLTARRNKAAEAGGVLYTTTPNSVQLGASGVDPNSVEGRRQRAAIVQQLTEDNTVGKNGYGPAVASLPSELSLMWPLQEGKSTAQAAAPATAAAAPAPGRAGRKLQQLPMPSNDAGAAANAALTDLKRRVDNVYQIYSTAVAGTSSGLQPVCPDLGASILETHVFAVDGNSNFSLPVNVLDDFGSKVLSGPGSDWIVALSQNTVGRQLTGAMRGQLSGGSLVLQGLSIQADPGSNLTLMLSAIPPPGSGDVPLSATLQVRVRPCLAGEYVVFSNSSAGQTQSCSLCAAPTYSFTAYPPPGSKNSSDVCQSCPDRGVCVAGMVIPESGCYQAHPRSAVIRKCPNTRACERGTNELLNLQGLQCSYRRYLNPEEIDPRPYTQMQCNRGYAGPFCSCCYRAGRNVWLLQQLDHSTPHEKGYTIADEIVVTTGQTNFEKTGVYGKSNGRCTRCPHLALAWIGFILSRGLDLLVIACISLLWMGFGWLSQSAAVAAFVELKQQRMAELRMRRSILGSRPSSMASLMSGASLSKPLKSATSDGMRTPNNSVTIVTTASRGAAAAGAGIQAQSSVSPAQVSNGIPLSFTGAGMASPPSSTAAANLFAAEPGEVLPPVLSGAPSSANGGSQTLHGGRRKSSVLYNLNAAPSLHWASAVNLVNMLRQHYAQSAAASADGVGSLETADPLAVQRAALLLMAVKHLACLAQVVLDGAQIAAVLLSQDLMFYVPDWAATALSAVLLTQANTWQYMPFECLIPGGSATSAAVVQTVVVTLLPIIYVAALYPLLMSLLSLLEHWMNKHAIALEHAHTAQSIGPNKNPAVGSSKQFAHGGQWSKSQSAWTVLTTVIVAAMAYCYSFYVANVTAAFNCMSLTTAITVPGEARIKGMVWVPDMQLACTSPPQAAAMAIAAVIGIPMLVGYWMLLLMLALPTRAASPAAIRHSSHRSPAVRTLSNFWLNIKRACLIPFRMLEHPVRVLQQYTGRLGVSGESCAALDVWNVEWRWWWLAGREMVKLVLVVVATLTTMRGPEAQARVLLLLVVLAAAFSWRTQAGCGTSMNQLQFVVFCWLQLLALLVVVPSMSNVNAAAFGGFLVALVALVMVQCGFVMACLVLRCLACTQGIGSTVGGNDLPQLVDDE